MGFAPPYGLLSDVILLSNPPQGSFFLSINNSNDVYTLTSRMGFMKL